MVEIAEAGESVVPGTLMVFNWKRGPNPLTAKEEEEESPKEELAEALPLDLETEIEIPEAIEAAPLLEEAARAVEPAPRPEAKPRRGKSAPPVSPFLPGRGEPAPAKAPEPAPAAAPTDLEGVAELRENFRATQLAFQERLEGEVREMNEAFERSLVGLSERVKSLSAEVAERDARLANQEAELNRLRTALRKVVAEAADLVQDGE